MARPPGTYRPTRSTGTQRSVTVPPGHDLGGHVGAPLVGVHPPGPLDATRPARPAPPGRGSLRPRRSPRPAPAAGRARRRRSGASRPGSRRTHARGPPRRSGGSSPRRRRRRAGHGAADRAGPRQPPRRSIRFSTPASLGAAPAAARDRSSGRDGDAGPRPRRPGRDRRSAQPARLDRWARLPVFPLGTVLFPGLVLPLHIFEQRYRELIRHLVALPEGDAPGVRCRRHPQRRHAAGRRRPGRGPFRRRRPGWDGPRKPRADAPPAVALHDVGCTAELRQVTELPDGRLDWSRWAGAGSGSRRRAGRRRRTSPPRSSGCPSRSGRNRPPTCSPPGSSRSSGSTWRWSATSPRRSPSSCRTTRPCCPTWWRPPPH